MAVVSATTCASSVQSVSEYALGKDDEGAYIEHYTTFKLFGNSQLKALTDYDNDGICAPQIRFYDPAEDAGYCHPCRCRRH